MVTAFMRHCLNRGLILNRVMKVRNTIHLTFRSAYALNKIEATIYDVVVYNAFNNYFDPIIKGDKRKWDILADEVLARVDLSPESVIKY